jgi:hypothetical protein
MPSADNSDARADDTALRDTNDCTRAAGGGALRSIDAASAASRSAGEITPPFASSLR